MVGQELNLLCILPYFKNRNALYQKIELQLISSVFLAVLNLRKAFSGFFSPAETLKLAKPPKRNILFFRDLTEGHNFRKIPALNVKKYMRIICVLILNFVVNY